MAQKDQYQSMLHQIRNLLTSNHAQESQNNVYDDDTKILLQQSYRMIEKDSFKVSSDPQLLHSKMSEASVLLTNESDMIKNYVRDKIQAEVFARRRDAGKINQSQYQKLIQAKQRLQKKRLQQKIEEGKKISKMIESARKYKKYESKDEVPLPQLQSLLHKERAFVDNIVKEQIKIRSQNNKIQRQNGVKIGPFGQKIQKKKSIISKQEQQAFKIQIVGTDQDQTTFLARKASNSQNRLIEKLKANQNFVKIFSAFLLDQAKKMSLASLSITKSEQNFNSAEKQNKKFTFSNQLLSEGGEQLSQVSMRQLCHVYKFKSFFEVREEQPDKKIKSEQIKKLISKRIGTSNKYHMKQCIIEGDTFYYTDQQNNDQQAKIKDMKTIEIGLWPIQQKIQTKEEGSFFQNKQTKVEVAVLKGLNRDFTFQLEVGEGVQLKEQISKVNLRRLHRMSCLISQRNNQDMLKFIEDQHLVLNLSEGYIRPKQQYPPLQLRQTFLKLLMGLFPQRKSTNTLNFTRCQLSIDQLKVIIKQCEKCFSNLQVLNFSHTKLDKQTFRAILNLILKSTNSSNLVVNLSFCGIDDDVIQANLSAMSEVCPKINQILLVGNQFTSKTVRNLRNVMGSKICEIRQINLSFCLIEDFKQLASLIKIANKLQVIKANQCRFAINNQSQLQDLLVSSSQKQQLKRIQLRRIVCTGTIKWFEQISPYLQIIADLPSKNSNKSLESKYLSVLLLNNK